jgi:hypothetical protein
MKVISSLEVCSISRESKMKMFSFVDVPLDLCRKSNEYKMKIISSLAQAPLVGKFVQFCVPPFWPA